MRGVLLLLLPVLGGSVLSYFGVARIAVGHAESAPVGANLTNEPYKLTPAEQETMLGAIEQVGVHVIRASIPPDDAGIEFAQRAEAHGIKIEFLLWLYPVAGTKWPHAPAGFSGLWRGYPLSMSDPERFRGYLTPLLAKLEDKGITLAGFELGNEINWAGFNADFTLPGQGRVLGADDLVNDPEGQQVAKGYLAYLKTMAVLKDIRDHSKLNRDTPIISGGLADLSVSTWTHTKRADAVDVTATWNFMRAHGLDDLVDGYGLHLYPHTGDSGKIRTHLEQNGLDECQAAGTPGGKPCWITEWGADGAGAGCPVDDSARIVQVKAMRSQYDPLVRVGRIAALMFYDWQGNLHATNEDRASAFRCGSLTESGRLAIAPLR